MRVTTQNQRRGDEDGTMNLMLSRPKSSIAQVIEKLELSVESSAIWWMLGLRIVIAVSSCQQLGVLGRT